MLLADLIDVSARVAATRSRNDKTALVADLLSRAEPDEVEVVATYLSGVPRQRRTGLGHRSLRDLPPPATSPTLTVADVDEALSTVATAAGTGSRAVRASAVSSLFGRATPEEQTYLTALVLENLRQGALDSILLDAIAKASGIGAKEVRRAAMYLPDSGALAHLALHGGGAEALAAVDMVVGRPVRPMLASSAPALAEALAKAGPSAYVDRKLDGIRVQVHRDGEEVRVYTRSLDDVTDRLPEVVAAARSLPSEQVVLDGEVIALGPDGRPRPFQETASRTSSSADVAGAAARTPLSVVFFDLLNLDGQSLVDLPLSSRLARLAALAPESLLVPRVQPATVEEGQDFFESTLTAGHEGVVVKAADGPYEAGRRGAGWIKVKPRLTLDLVVIGVEWGSGRRRGLLSNIHLAARDPDRQLSETGFVMLGKTFKGMSDEMLAWQTERFTELADGPTDGWVVRVRPEQVVEIALDGLQTSTRYPAGLALRFARVLRYRDDKTAAEADTIETVRGLA
ncbi:ATP-dependent DNA ligase [Nocardioides marmoribigeumensis]|uniref:Probable DNA ligase n=1 Tax=Nocardioides marmoribigeumensis TaxID=433649 RepID=A0ABU2BT00_9ACTN|nr:ATP-dependent DNA ligase [Nocardioides marmoribigeumensis]MDR7361124.1 DNA ligase-1 [Nocardioides marmoribigeumensis]